MLNVDQSNSCYNYIRIYTKISIYIITNIASSYMNYFLYFLLTILNASHDFYVVFGIVGDNYTYASSAASISCVGSRGLRRVTQVLHVDLFTPPMA